ncbi:MAG: XrtA/PEP-CTERM system histidine kinase PrsK, partial [Thiohalocapsa sp.]
YYGGEWTTVFQPLFFFGAGLVLVVLLFSGQLRSRLKVLINKHFFSYRYDYREEWLRLISILSGKTLEAALPERIVFALSELVESPGGAIWVRMEDGICRFGHCWNISQTEVDVHWDPAQFCVALSRSGRIMKIEAEDGDDPPADGVPIPEWMINQRSLWLLVPLFHEDQLFGFVILSKPRAPQGLDWENLQLLQTAARQAASYLALDDAATALAQARQFEGFNRLSAFVVHDLKNLIAQLSLVSKNAERYKHNQAFVDDAFQTVSNSVAKMQRLLAQLRSASASGREERVHLKSILEAVVAERRLAQVHPKLRLVCDLDFTVSADSDRLSAILGNVIQNAQDATQKDGQVDVRLSAHPLGALVEIDDDGRGMDEAFVRDRLFRPFDSTKGLSGMGIGAFECRAFVTSLGGRVEVESMLGKGTCFKIIIPADPVFIDRGSVNTATESDCKIKSPNY